MTAAQQGALADGDRHLLFASASRDVVGLLVVANVGQDYRDLMNAGKMQVDAARQTTRPA